jgi:carboxyl-terminal processing protease
MQRWCKVIFIIAILGIGFYFLLSRERQLRPAITGIGVQVRKENEQLRVESIVRNTPAARAGMHRGMWIQEIDGTNTADLSLKQCADLMRGPAGSTVRLRVVDEAAQQTNLLNFTRVKIALPESGTGKGP